MAIPQSEWCEGALSFSDKVEEKKEKKIEPGSCDRSWSFDDVLCRYVIAGSLFSVFNGLWMFAPDVGGRFGWSVNWSLAEMAVTIRGILYLFGAFVTAMGLYDCYPWSRHFRKYWSIPIIGICIISLNVVFGICMEAFANRAYVRGYWDGLHRRTPVDYRKTDISRSVEQFYLHKQK